MLQTSWKRWLASPSRVIQPLHWESTKAPQEVMMGLPQSSLSQALRSKGCGSSQVCDFLRSTFCCINFILSSPFWTTLLWTNFWWGHLFWQYSTSLSRSVCGTHSCSWVSLGSCCYTLSQVISTSLLDHLITFITWPSANNVKITHS